MLINLFLWLSGFNFLISKVSRTKIKFVILSVLTMINIKYTAEKENHNQKIITEKITYWF